MLLNSFYFKTKTSDIFSLGSVFYFITFDGTILSKELNMSYKDIKLKLKEKQEMINDQGNNKKILQMEMVTTLLNIKPEARPSVEKVLHHAFFWEDKRCLEFILDIRKKFDVLDTRFVKKIKDGMEYQKVLKEMLIARQLKVTLDSDKLVGHNGWKAKLDESLAEEFTGDYDKECVSDLLKAMRNKVNIPLNSFIVFIHKFSFDFKWMHLIELKDVVRDLFGNGSEGEYLRYFTAKFPRLLVHCYNAVEKEGKELLIEYFHDDASAQAPTIPIRIKSAETKFIINCKDDIAFSDMDNNSLDIIVICNSSRLFIEQNKSFNNFLHRNGSNVTHLEFFLGSLTFESLDKILQKLPNIQEIRFHGVEYGPSKAVLETIFLNPVQSVLWSAESSKLLKAFLECQTMQKLKVMDNNVTFEEILQKYASLEELKVGVSDMYPVSDQQKATSTIHQLKVLRITLFTKNEQIYKQVISSIIKQNILQQFHFNSFDNNSFSQSLYKPLAVHICQLERLNILMIDDEKLLKEVAAFVANSRVANTRLQEFTSRLSHFKSLPSSFLAYFTNLKQLVINCYEAEETKVADLISYMNKTQLTSIRLWNLSSACSLLLQKLQVHSLKILEIEIRNKVPVFDILREFLPRHPNITQFEIKFKYDYDEPKSLKLIPMILATLTKLERLEVWNHSKITAKDIKQITALETLKFWRINDHKSETFYKT